MHLHFVWDFLLSIIMKNISIIKNYLHISQKKQYLCGMKFSKFTQITVSIIVATCIACIIFMLYMAYK